MRLTRNRTVSQAISAFNNVLDDLDDIAREQEAAVERAESELLVARTEMGRARLIGGKIRDLIGA